MACDLFFTFIFIMYISHTTCCDSLLPLSLKPQTLLWPLFLCFTFLLSYVFSDTLKRSNQILILVQSNLVIRNFLVTLKLFLNAKCSLSLWSKLTIHHWKWSLNTNLFLIKTFLITKFDCMSFLHLVTLFSCQVIIMFETLKSIFRNEVWIQNCKACYRGLDLL